MRSTSSLSGALELAGPQYSVVSCFLASGALFSGRSAGETTRDLSIDGTLPLTPPSFRVVTRSPLHALRRRMRKAVLSG